MAIERLILVDRAIFVLEGAPECTVALVPLFNPAVSPRNMALVCEKATPGPVPGPG
jgi:hypothetical protein